MKIFYADVTGRITKIFYADVTGRIIKIFKQMLQEE
jgi:hypothetical protein